MSMLSEQIKELRTIANNLSIGHNMPISLAIERFRQAADTIEALSAKASAANMERSERYYNGGWILCEDRLPEIGNPVLICDENRNVCIRQIMRIDEFGMVWWSQYSTAIAWQLLPEPYRP